MAVYFGIIILLLISLLIYKDGRNNWVLFIDCALIFLIVALRDSSVGNDTENYVQQGLGYLEHIDYKGSIEQLWMLFIGFTQKVLTKESSFIQLTALLELIPLFVFLRKESGNMVFSLLIFAVINTGLCFYMTGIRQSIAVTFVLTAFVFLRNKKYWISILFFLLGVNFHATTIFAILLIPLAFLRLKQVVAYSLVLLSFLAGFIFKINLFGAYAQISGIFSLLSFYSGYSDYYITSIPNFFGILVLTLPSTILALCAIKVSYDDFFTKIFMIGVIFVNIFVCTPTIERYFIYFTMLQLIIAPSLYNKGNQYVRLLIVFYVMVLMVNFIKSVPIYTGTANYITYL